MPPTQTTAESACRISDIVPRPVVSPTRSAAVSRRLARETAKRVEHPPAPGGNRIVGGDQREIADRAGPLKRAEHDVIGVGRRRTREKLLALEGTAQRRQGVAKRRQALLAVLDDVFQAH